MTNQPLTSGEQNKIVIFFLLLLPTVFLGIGILLVAFLAFGIFRMHKSEDFGHIEIASRNFKWCAISIYAGWISFIIYFIFSEPSGSAYILPILIPIPIIAALILLMNKLFLTTLKNHAEWVVVNGIFSSKQKLTKAESKKSNIDMIKNDQLKSYSVAEELLKWAKLKTDGHITEEEFDVAKIKILKRL